MSLVNLLERTELFGASQEIRNQLPMALSNLITLVAAVAMHCRKAISDDSSESVNLCSEFAGLINAFHERCDKITESMWRYQLLVGHMDAEAGELVASDPPLSYDF